MKCAVILAGGQGERFWPLTHTGFPKYRLRIEEGRSLLRKTADRLRRDFSPSAIYVVTTRDHLRNITAELPGFPRKNILIEPDRKNTAAAIAFSMTVIRARHGDDSAAAFFPADHLIRNEAVFSRTLARAIQAALSRDVLVTMGIRPTFPATGYGYIRAGKALRGCPGAFEVAAFAEKPDRVRAERYLRDGRFYWNSGMFVWRSRVFFEALRRHAPALHGKLDLSRLDASYKKLPKISIDYALLEKADNLAVLPTALDWCDMGNWDMFHAKADRDRDGNVSRGKIRSARCEDSLVVNETALPLAVYGVRGVVAVLTPRGILICPKGEAEEAARFAARP